MTFPGCIWIGLLLFLPYLSYCQDSSALNAENEIRIRKEFYGFVRGGLYAGVDHYDEHKPYVSSAFSDFALKFEMENGLNFKAFADLRFRYGVEFLEPVNRLDFREIYIKVNGKRWDLSAGQKIVKWGRADFTNPTSKLSAQNLVSRSPDREDMDMGNLLSSFNWYPTECINFEAVAIPFYRSTVLIIDPIPLPDNVTINQIKSILTSKDMFSYGIRADVHLSGADWALSWFNGYDPMTGTALTDFRLDMSGPVPIPFTELSMTPYKTRVLGIDFETTAGSFGLRGEAAWSVPHLSYTTNEYVPLPELKWVFGTDWSSGVWRFAGEYSGKRVNHFIPANAGPLIGTEPDYALLAQLMGSPGFDLPGYVREQVGSFNRLCNYQAKRYYHTGAFRVETELFFGKLLPSVFSIYNFTSRDFLVIPEIRYKPSDGLTITSGAEFYKGSKGSLYDIIDDFMNSVYISLRVDF